MGVAPNGDATNLARDYGICVASTFDLRFMAVMSGCRPGGLGKMSKDYINVNLDKNWRITCSDWEAPQLSKKQLDYAAKDAHVAIEIFRVLAEKIEPKPFFASVTNYVKRIINEYCFCYLDQPFSGSGSIAGSSNISNSKNA